MPLKAFSEAKASVAASAVRSDREKIGGGSRGALLGEGDALGEADGERDVDTLADIDALRDALEDGEDDMHDAALPSPHT